MSFDREQLKQRLSSLAEKGVYVGTSSWKYVGWRGTLYDEARYVWRGRWSDARFERLCLAEYAEVFPTVSVDAAYYRFPDPGWVGGLVSQVPETFLFSLKVTDEITVKRFPQLSRYGARAGQLNGGFLDAERFVSGFLSVLEPYQRNIGLLIFEFSQFSRAEFPRGRDFVSALEGFLSRLPGGWRYGVEVRNRLFLHEDYFACLRRFGVTHVYNSWTDMPPPGEQLNLPASRTHDQIVGARFLLKPGRRFEEAVKRFSPYDRVREVYPEARAAGVRMIRDALRRSGRGECYIYVNNRLEGNAIETIQAMLAAAIENKRTDEVG